MNARLLFYSKVLSTWLPDRRTSVLVVAGGSNDRDTLRGLGFSAVTISNLDTRVAPEEISPYSWCRQDAESLSFADEAFDSVVVHAGLHHCHSPHRALLEMYRVARHRVVVVEPCDNFTVRTLHRFGLAQTYEHAAVCDNQCLHGGVANGPIPNFVYRWTEREVEKTISAFAPLARHRFSYAYGLDEPCGPLREKGRLKHVAVRSLMPLFRVYAAIFPKQRNLFAFMVEKPELPRDLFPWLVLGSDGAIGFNVEWGRARFKSR